MTLRAVEEEETHGGLIFREKWENESEWWKIIGRAFKTQSVPSIQRRRKAKRGGEKKSLGMLKINNVRQLFHCYSNLFKCYWRVFVPSRLLAAALMFEEAVPASAAVRPLPPPSTPSHTHPFLSSTLSAKTLSETEREKERESSENMRDSRWEESVWVWEEVTVSTCVRRGH